MREKTIGAIALAAISLAAAFAVCAAALEPHVSADAPGAYAQYQSDFNKNAVMRINLLIDENTLSSLFENAAAEQYVLCNAEINGVLYQNIGVRCKGNSSLSMVANSDSDRYSFKVKLDEYIDGQTFNGLSKFSLNNIIGDATYMKEYLSYDLLSYMGLPTPLYAFADIRINGDAWGLYLAVENIEEEFILRNYGAAEGNLYKPESTRMNEGGAEGNALPGVNENMGGFAPDRNGQQTQDAQAGNGQQRPNGFQPENGANAFAQQDRRALIGGMNGMGASGGTDLVYTDDALSSYSGVVDNSVFDTTTDADKEKVVQMIKALDGGENLETWLDVDQILRYFACNTFLVNLDSYAGSMKHNYYLYERNGVFTILPWDYNLSFGAFQGGDAAQVINFPVDSPVTDETTSPLIMKLLEVPAYKERYHQYLYQVAQSYALGGLFADTVQKLDALIGTYVQNDQTAFYSYEAYRSGIENLLVYAKDRSESVLAQLSGRQPGDSYGNIGTTLDLTAMGSMGMGTRGANNNGTGFDENLQGEGVQPFAQNRQSGSENKETNPSFDPETGMAAFPGAIAGGREGEAGQDADNANPPGAAIPNAQANLSAGTPALTEQPVQRATQASALPAAASMGAMVLATLAAALIKRR